MNLTIEQHKISPNAVIGGILGESAREQMKLCFDPSWQGYSTKIEFITPKGRRLLRRVGKKEIKIPDAVMEERGKTRIVIIGKRGKQIRMTTCAFLVVLGDAEETSNEGGAWYGE